jgi:hypothetical protein
LDKRLGVWGGGVNNGKQCQEPDAVLRLLEEAPDFKENLLSLRCDSLLLKKLSRMLESEPMLLLDVRERLKAISSRLGDGSRFNAVLPGMANHGSSSGTTTPNSQSRLLFPSWSSTASCTPTNEFFLPR